MSTAFESCRCGLHQQVEERRLASRRHASYRTLALTILGPNAPREDAALARALAEHAQLLRGATSISNVSNIADYRAA
jgi:hypothetical protein